MKTINKLTSPNLPLSLREGKKGNRNKKAFTLVELIIVISILAILATIAFTSFQNFTKDARDGNRITTLKNIESGLSLYSIKTNTYPDPEEYVEILGTGGILLSKQGIVGNDVSQKIKLNKEAKDPKDKTNYIYSITGNGKKYQLGTYLEENKLISYIPQITQTYANVDYSKRHFYTIGHKVGILLEDVTQKPILKTQTLTGINLETNTGSFKVYFSNDTQSGSYTNSGAELITTIVEEQKTTQTIKTTPTTINGVCGTANKIYSHTDTSYGADIFCETGTPNPLTPTFPVEGTPTNWTCEGSGSPVGTTANCSASKTATPINGACGTAHNLATPTQPTENLCTNGNPTSVTENTGNYTWDCEGVNLGTTANCSATRQYTVTFDSDGGTAVTSQAIAYNNQATTPTQPTKTGSTFGGWYSDVLLTTTYNFSTAVTADRTLYAKWNVSTYLQLCTGTPVNGEIYYTDSNGNKLASVTSAGTETWENGKTLANLTCNTKTDGTNDGGHIIVCSGVKEGSILQACNLGATGVGATTTTAAYGNVYQWGRTDTTWAQGSLDWKSPADSELWGVSEANKTTATWANSTDPNKAKMQGPCPTGYHVPTNKEWVDVITAWQNGWTNGTNLSNALKLPFAGDRNRNDGGMSYQGSYGNYWSSSPNGTDAYLLVFDYDVSPSNNSNRATGLSVRCFKN